MGRGQERTTSVESLQPRVTARMVRSLAIQALQNSDFRDVLEVMGTDPQEGAAGVAFRTMVAESVAECAIRALREAKRRKTRMGAAAIIIAAEKR